MSDDSKNRPSAPNPASGTMDLEGVDWDAIRGSKESLPFAETDSSQRPSQSGADRNDGAVPFAQAPAAQARAPQAQAAQAQAAQAQAAHRAHTPQPQRAQPPIQRDRTMMSPYGLRPQAAPPQAQAPRAPQPHAPQPHATPQPQAPQPQAPQPHAPQARRPPPAQVPQAAPGASPWTGGVAQAQAPATPSRSTRAATPRTSAGPVAAPKRIETAAKEAAPARGLIWLWGQSGCSPRLRRHPALSKIIDALEERPIDADLDDVGTDIDDLTVDDRRELYEVLARGDAVDGAGLRQALRKSIRPDGKVVPPIALIAADLSTPFDERGRTRATITTVAPLMPDAGEDAPKTELSEAVADAERFLENADDLCPDSVLAGLSRRIVTAFEAEERDLPNGYLEGAAQRVLLERRLYQSRPLFGGPHLRTLLHVLGCETPVPTYLPADVAAGLPLYARFPVRIVAEVHHKKDENEQSELALRALAIARVVKPIG